MSSPVHPVGVKVWVKPGQFGVGFTYGVVVDADNELKTTTVLADNGRRYVVRPSILSRRKPAEPKPKPRPAVDPVFGEELQLPLSEEVPRV
jgi:hypothetical protein